ncbi:ATP-binding cassette domain-containing protein [Bradyrhizobium sp. HKCCYLS3077]|uniref:ATP-binding cassette domain-containing protein n=1 Tax=Bradyrhizobium sp. HKCCYLS3077 TaxID=3420761 RepID=UPI003EBB83C6
MTALLELVDICKTFELERRLLPRLLGARQQLHAVNSVSLKVPRGGVLGVVGESGCGKSTLAQIIMRLERQSSGRILFDGHDISALDGAALHPFRRRFQMVFQDSTASLNPRKTVQRTLQESLALAGTPKPQRASAATDLLGMVGLDAELRGRYPHQLSGGQRQRVAIARALAMQPELLVADEPVSSLDVSLQAQILRLLISLRQRLGLTMIFISHDLALVHHLCSEVAVMQAGVIVEQGTPAQVLREPRHDYTKKLLAAVPRASAHVQQRVMTPISSADFQGESE